MKALEGKKIMLGVTGGIAAYKAAEVVRLLAAAGAEVTVVMTRAAREFIGVETMTALSGRPVITEMFGQHADAEMKHIRVPERSDLVLVAPATANFIAKAAHGMADDALSTMLLVAKCPVLIAPAMNSNMYANQAVVENIETLERRGIAVIEPDSGELACGYTGKGRLAPPERIFEEVIEALTEKDLAGEKILITAGPTREPIDPVRYVTNRSSGKMGYALAKAAARRGAAVTLITGPTSIKPPEKAWTVKVETANEMFDLAKAEFPKCTILLMAAAVADYSPQKPAGSKIKRTKADMAIEMKANPDIVKELSASRKKNQIIVGFAAETDDLIENAKKKIKSKGLDMIVANQVGTSDSGFDYDTNRIKIIDPAGRVDEFPLMSKDDAANRILDRLPLLRKKSRK